MPSARRLAAVVFTDLEGFTSAAHSDEAGALDLLQVQDRLVRLVLTAHHGRKVKSMGDGLLLEFPNARDAVEGAVELQRSVQEHNATERTRPLRLRVGIHVGDVEHRGPDILGDAVNIASRIEPLAEAGGICLSGPAFDQVRGKVPYRIEKMASKALKGVAEPVDIYHIVLPWKSPAVPSPGFESLRLAVLPFANISPDAKDEYFADGLTEELITVLSQLQGFQVIARTSVLPYKSGTKPLGQIGAELGVGTVLEGSVRKAGDQLRITAQLIEVSSQGHLWSSTYDRKLEDIFAVQAEVAERIAAVLKVKLGRGEGKRLETRPETRPESYLAYLRGRSQLTSGFSEETLRGAKEQFELAASLDPKNARAFSGLADVTTYLGWFTEAGPRNEWLPASRDYATHAVELDPDLAEGHCSLGMILWDDWNYVDAEREFQLALSLNPSYAFARHEYAALLLDQGRVEKALPELELAIELDPQSINNLAYNSGVLCALGRPKAALPLIERIRVLSAETPEYHFQMAWYHYALSDFQSSLRELERGQRLLPRESDPVHRGWLRALLGERAEARRLLDGVRDRPNRRTSYADLATGYAFLGDFDEAFRFLFKGADEHDLALQIVRNDVRLEPLRRDPRFSQLLKKMNLG